MPWIVTLDGVAVSQTKCHSVVFLIVRLHLSLDQITLQSTLFQLINAQTRNGDL